MRQYHTYGLRPIMYEVDKHLPTFDNTKLVATNTCPTWGIMRYGHHRTLGNIGRALALEAGHAIHECVALIRFLELLSYGQTLYSDTDEEIAGVRVPSHEAAIDAGYNHISKQFDRPRFEQFEEYFVAGSTDAHTFLTRCYNLVSVCLDNSGYVDDPNDRYRTLSNMEEAVGEFAQRYRFGECIPLVTTDGIVGIEQGFQLVFVGFDADGVEHPIFRFTGKIDEISVRVKHQDIIVGDNKTTSRMSDAWEMSHEMAHQFTGYFMATSVLLGLDQFIERGRVIGIQLPQPRSSSSLGIRDVPIFRKAHMFVEWFDWAMHTFDIHNLYHGDVANAPKYTHSCSRFFRPCPLIPYCAAEPDERVQMFDELTVDEWNPLGEEDA